MVAFARRSFSGSAPDSFLTSPMDGVTLTATCSNLTGWPDGSGGNFVVIFDPGTVNEEKCLASARTGNVLTLVARAFEESAVAHSATTCVVRHGYSAHDADEANNAVSQTIGAIAAKGDLLVGSAANTLVKVGVGTTGQALIVAGGTWVPGTPSLATDSNVLANDFTSSGGNFGIFTTASLATGVWLLNFGALVSSVGAQSFALWAGPLGATATLVGQAVAEVPLAAGVLASVNLTALVTVTVAGTLQLEGQAASAITVKKLSVVHGSTTAATGYTAVKIA